MNRLLKRSLPAVFWLLAWALAARWVGLDLLLPGPLAVGSRLAALAGTGGFWLSVGATLGRVFLGLAWGALAGAALAFATHFSPWADRLLSPAVRVVRATPVVSFILLVYLWVPRGAIPWVIAGLMVLPVVWGAVSAGLDGLDEKLLELARAYRFSRGKTLALICLPATPPRGSPPPLGGPGCRGWRRWCCGLPPRPSAPGSSRPRRRWRPPTSSPGR